MVAEDTDDEESDDDESGISEEDEMENSVTEPDKDDSLEDEVEYGGNIVITECLESGEQFRLERELEQFMINPSQNRRGRGRGRVACRVRGGGRRLFN